MDCSSIQLDGSHTPAKNGGQAVGFQGRKATRTTNTLFLAGKQGVMLAYAAPQAGNHHDLFEIEALFTQLCGLMEQAGISLNGLFLDADSDFDSQKLRQACQRRHIEATMGLNCRSCIESVEQLPYFDELLYRRRGVIEQANGWLDSFKTLLVRYETCVESWLSFHWLAFVVLFLRKIQRRKVANSKS